ncbi:MAG: ABC transporter substrate-binding protein [Kiloniellales bacterium]
MSDRYDGKPLGALIAGVEGGRWSRRRVLQGAVASGAALGAASLWRPGQAEAGTPKRGGIFRVGLHDANTADTLDPATANGEFTVEMAYAIRNCLTEILPDGTVVGELAEGWEASSDAAQWTFTLREGITFHNGKPLTAADVRDSLLYHLGEDSKSGGKALLATVTDIKADGNKVIITTSSGYADLPYALADFHFTVCPSDGAGKIDVSGPGTGPYVVEMFEAGVGADLTRNPNYFKDGRAHFDGVKFLAINDPAARANALLTDEVDAISDIELKTARLFAQQDEVVIDDVPSGAHATLPMDMRVAPFDNHDVRMALKLAIDRQGAVDRALRGFGSIGNDQPISPSMPYYTPLPQREYDPEKAKHHLKKAGLDSLKVTLSAADSAFNGAVDLAVLYSEDAKKAGIDIEVKREPNDGYWSNVWMKKPFVVSTWSARPTPDVMFSTAYKSGADWNESRFSNERFDKLLAEAKSELDNVKRTELYHEMMQIVRDDGGVVIPFFRNRVMGRRTNVEHEAKISGISPLDGSRAAERWWFAS